MNDSTNNLCPRSTPWCTQHEHDADQCASTPVDITPGCSVWLLQELAGLKPTIVIDASADSISLDDATQLSDAIQLLRRTASTTAPAAAVEPPQGSDACPVWCTAPAGHPVDAQLQDRMHERDVAQVVIDHGDPGRSIVKTYTVHLEQYEDRTGGTIRVWPQRILLDDLNDVPMTGPQARQVAAALLDAADLWDLVTES